LLFWSDDLRCSGHCLLLSSCCWSLELKARKGAGVSGKSGKKTSAPNSGGLTDAKFVRKCRNLREHTSHADGFGKLNDLGGDPCGAPSEREGILSLKQCEELKSFADLWRFVSKGFQFFTLLQN
jgi:hypothetical protein